MSRISSARMLPFLALAVLASRAACAPAAAPAPPPAGGTPSLDVKIDQVGYLPGETKLAMVTSAAATGGFLVRRADGTSVLTGTLSPAAPDADSGDVIRLADFSALAQPGTYHLEVAGTGTSFAFEVADDVYATPYMLALRSFYGQRCGTAVDLAPSHPGYTYPACHLEGSPNPDAVFHGSSGRGGTTDGTGGWHDAGDYGKYIVNSGITTGTLLWTYEWFPDRIGSVNLRIPESGNAVPDILDEVKWNLDWMLKMQDTDGGVWHKLTSARFGGFVMPHVDDGGPRLVIGTGSGPFKSTCATADFAAVMAAAARIYRPFDSALADRYLAAARRAWDWTAAHPAVLFKNCCGVSTGEYGDGNCTDERLWAAAELFRTTGEAAYNDHFLASYTAFRPTVRGAQAWPAVGNLAMWSYAFSGRPNTDAAARGRIAADTVAEARRLVDRAGSKGYRTTLEPSDYVWGSNGVAANYSMLLVVADAFERNDAFRNTALGNLHYLFGRNPFSLSWLTQVGDRPFQNPHHRPSGGDTNAAPWPGLLSGGPNANGGDRVIDALPASPPMRRYSDHQDSYASNENAINWNAPLVFVLASTLPPS